MPQEILTRCLRSVPRVGNEDLLVGTETYDDAGVYRIDAERALVQTVDLFTPVVDDPRWFGSIAAANSLSDVYAMGGKPLTALGILGFPGDLDPSVMTEILTGSAEKVAEAGAVVAGGHTIVDPELKFGLAVTGIVHPDRVVRNSTARPGDRIVLTKPLGSGLVTTGLKRGVVTDEGVIRGIMEIMATLNAGAAAAMMEVGVSAATDVTGFGLLGHALSMARASETTLAFDFSAMPLYPEDLVSLAGSCMSGGTSNNRRHVLPEVEFAPGTTPEQQVVLFDAQTSGGLLICVPAEKLDRLLEALKRHGVATRAVVGEVLPRAPRPLLVRP